ncbi:MAG TPA: hypothetical protein VFX76_15705, partial [Roseiflexaceae bacterium]|nr:hypothetical protein [Roseiflexaceae bacterium]
MSEQAPNAAYTNGNGSAPSSFWQRVTLKQIAIGTALVALVLLALVLVVALRYVLLLLFLSIVVATALSPLAERLRNWGVSQSVAVLIAFGLLIALVAGIIAA